MLEWSISEFERSLWARPYRSPCRLAARWPDHSGTVVLLAVAFTRFCRHRDPDRRPTSQCAVDLDVSTHRAHQAAGSIEPDAAPIGRKLASLLRAIELLECLRAGGV